MVLCDDPAYYYENMLESWLTDGACNHSDLIYFPKQGTVEMWCFSPFQTRPLGKELPSLLQTCTCPNPRPPKDTKSAEGSRRIWRVVHNGKDRSALKDVEVLALCSACGQTWKLPTEHLDGQLRKLGGLFAAVVPYFALNV